MIQKLSKQKNILNKTRAYLAGAMQYVENGRGWRDKVKEQLNQCNITFFDPYHRPFIHDTPEDESSRSEMLHWMETEQYDLVTQRIKEVRRFDLRLVDISDWFICVISPKIPSWGTAEELSVMVKESKPVFVVIDDPKGKKKTPLWVMSMVDHKYIYNSLDEAISTIKAIDDGIVKLNSNKWKLLLPNMR
jgi:nucleoside 2-deoxyribosyltransferase